MRLCVHGDSLFAWVSAAKLAETGNQVLMRTSGINNSFDPSREPNLHTLLTEQELAKRLQMGSLADEIPSSIYIHLIAVDLAIDGVEGLIADVIKQADDKSPLLFLVLSTLPIGSFDRLQLFAEQLMSQQGRTQGVSIVGLPLFCREGTALVDFSKPENLLISGENGSAAITHTMELMRPFVRQASHIMIVPHTTAELIKMGVNAMLATRISFINEMASLSEKLGVDIELVREGLAADPRIGSGYLQAGCGFGGPSFSDDLLSYAKTLREEIDTSGLIDAVLAINESQREILFRKVWRFFHGKLAGKKIAIWGAAFKAGTASLENSVVHPLLQALWAQGCITQVFDPLASEALYAQYGAHPLLVIAKTAEEATQQADALVLVTAWDEFWSPDFEQLKKNLKQAVVFDGRNMYEPDFMLEQGFRYFAIGRGESI
jgi:UDPglucose 6-dehydrogenase